jgi:hypothetical protein
MVAMQNLYLVLNLVVITNEPLDLVQDYPEDGGSHLLHNIGTCIPMYMVSYPIRLGFSSEKHINSAYCGFGQTGCEPFIVFIN